MSSRLSLVKLDAIEEINVPVVNGTAPMPRDMSAIAVSFTNKKL